VGGTGGAGGNGQDVTVDTTNRDYKGLPDTIKTAKADSDGILAQSIGQGGGNGGFTVSVAGAAKGASVAFAMGGGGGAGGNGGTAAITSDANITTLGYESTGLFAQSVGKGGGNGGVTVAGALELTGVGIGVALGGSGGDSGSASRAQIINSGTIETAGADSDGIFVQSVGKGGGNAGVTVAAAASAGGNTSGDITVAVGGKGGRGGDAGPAILKNYGDVTVTGPQSRGLVAESTGGGGGNANLTISATLQGKNAKELALAVGGNGEVAGNGGDVDLVNTATVQTGSSGIDPAMAQNSPGIVASSGGGSGGSGSLTAAVTLGSGGSSTPLEAAVAVGGAGLGGGDAGTVTLTNSGSVTTYADKSPALEGSSIGGGGGDAGYVLAGTGTLGGQTGNALGASVAVGQGGGTGGIGGDVTVTNTNATLTTAGMNSDAIQAHSEGGGGGNAAAVLAFTATTVKNEVALNLAVGGKGGKGATGGAVTVENSGALITTGQNSDGIRADSEGGTGGNGAITLSGLALNEGYAADISLGGDGGSGDTGGDVTAISHGAIVTTGVKADGISAMSTGGGGGSALQTTAAGLSGMNVDVGVGGVGGSGDNGGIVKVENYDSITTTGAESRGIFAQSTGGGGGDSQAINVGVGGTSEDKSLKVKLTVSVGRPGASGGNGGTVTVTNNGDITTGGMPTGGVHDLSSAAEIPTYESGIVAQSVGGSGGNGGSALILPGVKGGDSTYTFSVAVGGGGGEGGVGGATSVDNRGKIITFDTESYGIFAQSIGGGGGKGGIATAIPGVLANGSNTLNISASVGGEGGEGNAAGTVTVNNYQSVTTHGDGSHGVFAQSVGGGGGDGGSAFNYFIGLPKADEEAAVNFSLSLGGKGGSSGVGKTVNIANSGIITTTGDGANGIEAQSIGGGGGEAGNGARETTLFKTVTLNVGGNGGEGENGGTVTINQTSGGITTAGNGSSGIYAQSIGGGGGRGGVGLASPLFSVGLGGSGGANGNGGDVTVNMKGGLITTKGSGSSAGIFAQSVGGGGGEAGGVGFGIIDTPYYTPPPNYIGTSIPMGSGDSSGDGGAVIVVVNAKVATTGDGAVGVFAQSVGGGGGLAGEPSDACSPASCSERVGSVGAHGAAGPVTVTLNGTITTGGQYSHGVFAQSAAGSASRAGDVSISIKGGSSLLANGADADAIFAQSVGGANGTITVINGGIVRGGSADSYGVHYLDGGANTLINGGTITTLNGVNGIALRTDGGHLTINNTGSIIGVEDINNAPGGSFATESITNTGQMIGNVEIHNQPSVTVSGGKGKTFGSWSGGAITISNGDLTFAGGNTALGDDIVVNGGAGTVTNDGRLLVTAAVAVTGNFDQSASGKLDFLLSSSSDPTPGQLSFTGAASLAGGLGIDLARGFHLAAGDSFDLIGSDGALSGGFGAFSLDGAACSAHGTDDWRCGGFLFDLSMETGKLDSVDLTVVGAGVGSGAVPEPSTWAMLAAGFLGLGGLALRRRQRALAA
jgi:hypothetical protein